MRKKCDLINNKPIGIFDSGIGGVTVLEKIVNEFPNEDYVYLGDTKNCPYGIKTKEEIMSYVRHAIKYLEKQDVKMIVIGCNTATVNSYDVKSLVNIIRIIEPTAKEALRIKNEKDKDGKIIVLATNYTIDAKGYDRFLGGEMIGVRSSDFVPIAEKGLQNTDVSLKSCEEVLKDVKGKGKVIILGCTHFGLLENDIRKVLGDDIITVESSACITQSVRDELERVGYNEKTKTNDKGHISISVTGKASDVHIEWFKKEYDGIFEVED